MRVELRLRDVHSLKEKRHTVRSVTSHLAKTFGVAVAEVDRHDQWQRATLGIAAVSAQPGHLTRVLHTVERALRERRDVELLDSAISHLEDPA